MRRSAYYFPIVPNRLGELTAIGHLSPRARARSRPIFEIDRPASADARDLEEHVTKAALQIGEIWGSPRPILLDLPQYGPEHRMQNKLLAIEHMFTCAHQQKMLPIPVAGPASARGPEMLEAIGKIARRYGYGAALRVPYDELSHPEVLRRELINALQLLALTPSDVDLILDLEHLHFIPEEQRNAAHLTAVSLEAVAIAHDVGEFRNVVLCGSSAPEKVGKEFNGVPYRGARIEFGVWATLQLSAIVTVAFADHGITPPRSPDPRGHGPAPARIRLSTPTEHVFHRAPYKDYISLCKSVVVSEDFDHAIEAWGATSLRDCARGFAKASSPTTWVARDANLHIEATVLEIERRLKATGRIADFLFPKEEKFPWVQSSISDHA